MIIPLAFVIKRAGWKVKKIHVYLTFEQKRFKNKFILMNRQESKNNIEKDFYKLMIIPILAMIVEIILTIANLFQYLMNLKKLLTLGDTGIFLIEEFVNLLLLS